MKRVAFLFDNDGVLIDSSALHWEAWQLLMQQEPELKMEYQEFTQTFGMRNDLILQKFAPHISQEIHKEWALKKETLFRECAREKIKLIPGMESFLKQVLEAHIPHIIASSTPIENLELFIHSTALGKYFDLYLSAEHVAHGKPAPDIFIAAAQKLEFEPQECIVFEDAPAGVSSGKAAGCFVVALETTHSKEALNGYDLVYSSPYTLDLQEILHAFSLWKL